MSLEIELWEDVINHPSYEICSTYPYPIRKKATDRILKERLNDVGYYQVWLDGKNYYKHRLIVIQWVDNDDPALKIQVDHKNRDRSDNHISNLRWTTPSENNYNRSGFNRPRRYIDELSEEAIEVGHYGNHDDISDLFYHDDVFYIYDGNRNNRYRIANKHMNSYGQDYVEITLPNGLRLKIFYSKFRREYDLD